MKFIYPSWLWCMYDVLTNFVARLTIWLCKQRRDCRGLNRLRTPLGWFLWTDLQKDPELLHLVVHKHLCCNSYSFNLAYSVFSLSVVCLWRFSVIFLFVPPTSTMGSIYIHTRLGMKYSVGWFGDLGWNAWNVQLLA